MKIISPANEIIMTILGAAKDGTAFRMLHFVTEEPVKEGVLLYNLLTKELVLLSQEEYENRLELEYLRKQWFVVPAQLQEKDFATKVRWVENMRKKSSPHITSYTIFTTTDCNARCFYCFELGWKRLPMTEETAKQTLEYIKKHCGGKKIGISWFGGEPLYNMAPMDLISQGLRDAGIEYTSTMITNGYLLDAQAVEKAKNLWNMQRLQIALDGTEAVYNKIKAYIYKDVNPYRVVMHNIGLALDAGIAVSIRLNMDLSNHQNLLELVDELAQRFEGKKRLSIYAHHLFNVEVGAASLYTPEEWSKRDAAMVELEKKIEGYGLASKVLIPKALKLNHCMADSDNAIVIHSSGALGRCEHFSESEICGHVTSDEINMEIVRSWKEQLPEIPECATCFNYPSCISLKKCSSAGPCFLQARETKLRRVKREMRNEYKKWQMTKK